MLESLPTALTGERFLIPSDVQRVDALRDAFAAFLQGLCLTPEAVESWKLVFSEALVNAIEHGNRNNPAIPVEGAWWVAGDTIYLETTDHGLGPPEERLACPTLPTDPLDEGGRGLFLIQQLTDGSEHWRGTGGYRARLHKRHPEIVQLDEQEVLEQALDELSTSYESLAAFYRLGEGLVNAENVSRFLERAFDDLATVARHDFLTIAFTRDFQPGLEADLRNAPRIATEPLSPLQRKVETKADEFVWETAAEVADDPVLGAFGCGICTPVAAGGQRQGLLTIARRESQPYFNAGELNTIRTFADLIGIAVVSANNTLSRSREARALRELEIASEMQHNLLPLPKLLAGHGWDLFVRREGAREVAGDHLEVASNAAGDLYLVCIDVMGKGVAAAFLAAIFRTAFHLSLDFTASLDELTDKLNRVLIQQMGELTMFATCAIARVPADLSEVEIINAGHCPVILGRASGEIVQVDPSGPPLGLFPDSAYQVERLPLQSGDALVMVTDGLYEWEVGGDIWGWDTLVDFYRTHRAAPPETFWNQLRAKIVGEGEEGLEASDDRTILYWRRLR